MQLAAIGQPVSVCHQWSITGTPSRFSAHRSVGGIGALAGEEERAQRREIVLAREGPVGVLALDGADGGGRGEEGLHAVLGDDAEEGAGVRRAHRLALVEDRRAAVHERAVDDVRVADRPADVGGVPSTPRPAPRRRRSACSSAGRRGGRRCRAPPPSAARWCPTCRGCRAGRWRRNGHAVVRRCGRQRVVPVDVAAVQELGALLLALQDDDPLRPVLREREGALVERLVGDDAVRLQPARGGEQQPRPRVVDAGRRLRWQRSRRTPPSARRRAVRRRAWRSPPRAPSACR